MTDGPLKDLAELSIRELCEEREAAQLELENARADLELTRSEKVAALARASEAETRLEAARDELARVKAEAERLRAVVALYEASAIKLRELALNVAEMVAASGTETKG